MNWWLWKKGYGGDSDELPSIPPMGSNDRRCTKSGFALLSWWLQNGATGAPKEYARGQTQHGKTNWFILEPSKTKTLSTSGKSEEPSQLPLLSQYIISSPCPNSSLARAPSPDPWSKGKNPTLEIWFSPNHKEAQLAAGFSVSDPGETFWWPGTKY